MKQKIAVYLFLWVFSISKLCAQLNTQLCNVNEVIVFAFKLKNKKWVAVCKEKNEKYIVYRSGTDAKIDLQFPSVLDSSSWRQFVFQGYMRGGGKENEAMNFANLYFTNNNINYTVYEDYTVVHNKSTCGVMVEIDSKTTDLNGILFTRKGNLLDLWENKKIRQDK